jgi:hypothetical protein
LDFIAALAAMTNIPFRPMRLARPYFLDLVLPVAIPTLRDLARTATALSPGIGDRSLQLLDFGKAALETTGHF